MKSLILTAGLFFFTQGAHTSEVYFKNKIITGCVELFCETKIGEDILPKVIRAKNLAGRAMSAEDGATAQAQLKKDWDQIAAKYKNTIKSSRVSEYVLKTSEKDREIYSKEAWSNILQSCPERAKLSSSDSVLALLNHLIWRGITALGRFAKTAKGALIEKPKSSWKYHSDRLDLPRR